MKRVSNKPKAPNGIAYQLFYQSPWTGDIRIVAEFNAVNDSDAWTRGTDAYEALPSANITVVYQIRQKDTGRIINNPSEVA